MPNPILQQRNYALDDAAARRPLLRKIDELEAILENPHASEPVKAEVRRELREAYEWQKMNHDEILDEAQKAVKAVRLAIYRFHRCMENAQDPRGNPHPVLRPFAAYLKQYLLIPTARFCKPGGATTSARLAGRFTYEPPQGVEWKA